MRLKNLILAVLVICTVVFSSCAAAPISREENEKIVTVKSRAQVVIIKNTGGETWKNVIVALIDGHENRYEWKERTLEKGKSAQLSFNYFKTKTGSVLTGNMLDGIVSVSVEYNIGSRWKEINAGINDAME
jgi:hypothetical protein